MLTRRQFLKAGVATGAGLVVANDLGWSQLLAAQAAVRTPLPGSSIPQFIQPLPLLEVAGGSIETVVGETAITLTMHEVQTAMLPPGFLAGYTGTWVWSYRVSEAPEPEEEIYINPVVIAERGTPLAVTYVNELGIASGTRVRAWYEATDQTLHWADPLNSEANHCMHRPGPASGDCLDHYDGPVLAVPHLHGGEVPPVVDGGPDAWFTSDGAHHGHAYYAGPGGGSNTVVYTYPNTQEAAPLWFHDHVLGLTRLDVYAGLAGAYVLVDRDTMLPTGLHPVGLQQGSDSTSVDYLIPLVIQDRMFDTAGQLYFPNVGINPEHPYWIPEFVGDTIVVNGKVWPFLNVEPRRYRFLLINGSNARTYELFFTDPVTNADGPTIWQIGTDGGYLDVPVPIGPNAGKSGLQKLLLMPGERADVIVDFSSAAGQTLLLRNTGRTPYPKGESPHGSTLGRITLVRVGPGPVADASYDPASGIPLRKPMIRLVDPAAAALAPGVTVDKTRQLTLNEVEGPGGPLEVLVNNTKWSGKRADGTARSDFTPVPTGGITEYLSELPLEGTTEVWEIVNLTADAHPIHLHLVQFQLLNRQGFNTNRYSRAYEAAFPGGEYVPGYGPPLDYTSGNRRALGGNPDVMPYLQGPARPPAANEAGWKDTIMARPGEVTRIAIRFAPTDKALDADPADLVYPFDPDGHGYVWHCHIIDHEDNEMMRPYRVQPAIDKSDRTYREGIDY
jgi:FtsP/CotA-like multicopper oxidase with cupredoxin domain